MEEESVRSLPDITDLELQPPQQESWTSLDHPFINGDQSAIVWGETEVQIHQEHGIDQPSEEAEPWEQIIWPVRPVTCASPPLAFATVQWDMPDPSAQPLVTDISLANELDCRDVTSPGTTSPSPHPSEDVNAELFTRADAGEDAGFDLQLLNSALEWTENGSEPCDAADEQESVTQEKEDSTHGLSDTGNEIPSRTDSEEEEEEEEEGHSVTSEPVETVDLIETIEEPEGSDGADSFIDLKLEEEQEEPCVLLTAQGDSEEEQNSVIVIEAEGEKEEGAEVEEEKSVTTCAEESEDAEAASRLSNLEVPAEPLQTDDTGAPVNPDKLIDLQQSELLEDRRRSGTEEDVEVVERLHEDPRGRTEETEMCKDVGQDVDPEHLEADDSEEAATQMTENVNRIGTQQEKPDLTEKPEADCDQTTSLQDVELSPPSEQIQAQEPRLEESPQMELTGESTRTETADLTEESPQSRDPRGAERQEQTEPPMQKEQTPQMSDSAQATVSEKTDETKTTERLSPETEVNHVDKRTETSHQEVGGDEDGSEQTVVANGGQPKAPETTVHMNGGEVDREKACRLAERLFKLDGIQRVDVVKHLDKDNDFSRAVGEEYLQFFDFTGQTLDQALRSFLKVVILIGETQERERVLQHFASRFHQCNPDSFSSSGAVLALTCALMLLNTDLHGQNVGKSMSSSKFVSNLDEMNDGGNFSKDLLKSLYNSIKSEPLEWAVDEEELKSSVLVDEDAAEDAPMRSKANPFQDVPHDKTASVVKEGFLQRKLHADIDGKRTPWGKRGWKTFFGVLRGMVLYLQKDDYRKDQPTNEEVVSVHHSLAEQASDYTKKPHVFRLQTADWRVFLFQASSKVEMNSWISRINLVSALHSSPPFPAAVGSQRRFCRPILPAVQSAHTLERQLQSHAGMLESFKGDLLYLQENPPEGKKAKAKELEEHRVRAEYLQHEVCRYESYIQVLEAWKNTKKTDEDALNMADLCMFDKALCADSLGEEDDEEGGLKKSHSSPSLELEMPPPTIVKVRRNISERRTYRRTIIPRWNKEV